MTTPTGAELAEGIRAAVAEFKSACAGVDEQTAGRAPAGRWSPKEILSHLIGPEGGGMRLFDAYLIQDTPRIDLVPEQTYFTGERQALRFAQLVELLEQRFEVMAAFVATLSGEQLARTAYIPVFKDSPFTDHPTLAVLVGVLGQGHVRMHADHLREILAELAAK